MGFLTHHIFFPVQKKVASLGHLPKKDPASDPEASDEEYFPTPQPIAQPPHRECHVPERYPPTNSLTGYPREAQSRSHNQPQNEAPDQCESQSSSLRSARPICTPGWAKTSTVCTAHCQRKQPRCRNNASRSVVTKLYSLRYRGEGLFAQRDVEEYGRFRSDWQ